MRKDADKNSTSLPSAKGERFSRIPTQVKGYSLDHQRYHPLLHFHIKRLRESLSGRLVQMVVLSSWADLGYGKIGPAMRAIHNKRLSLARSRLCSRSW